MTKFDETIMTNGAQNVGNNIPNRNKSNVSWKSFTIGGITGIFFGAASSIGANTYLAVKRGEKAAEAETQEEVKEETAVQEDELKETVAKSAPKEAPKAKHTAKAADEKEETAKPDENEEKDSKGEESVEKNENSGNDDDEKSFADTFQAAREAQGPGGLFVWDGKVCTTYTEEEWNNLTDEEREEFALNAQIYTEEGIEDATIDTIKESDNILAQDTVKDTEIEEATLVTDDPNVKESITEDGQPYHTQDNVKDSAQPASDDDVQIIGTKTVTLPNGQVADMAHVRMHDEDVAVIDMDQDGVADIAMADLNHNGNPDEGEIVDLHTKEVISTGSSFAQSQPMEPETDPSVGGETGFESNVNDAPVADEGVEYFSI